GPRRDRGLPAVRAAQRRLAGFRLFQNQQASFCIVKCAQPFHHRVEDVFGAQPWIGYLGRFCQELEPPLHPDLKTAPAREGVAEDEQDPPTNRKLHPGNRSGWSARHLETQTNNRRSYTYEERRSKSISNGGSKNREKESKLKGGGDRAAHREGCEPAQIDPVFPRR